MAERVSSGEGHSVRVSEPNVAWMLRQVEAALRGLRYGTVTVQVQDGVAVQVERTERQRYQRGAGEGKDASP